MTTPTTEALLDAALEQFALVGLRRTSADDIARRAGVNRATLYRRLGNKEEIVAAALIHEATRVLTTIEAAIGEVPGPADEAGRDFDPADYVVRFFSVTLSTLFDNRLLQQMLQVDAEQTLAGLTAGAGPTLALSSGLVRDRLVRLRAHTGASVDAEEADLLAITLARLAQSLLVTRDAPPDLGSPAAMERYARAVVVPMVLGR